MEAKGQLPVGRTRCARRVAVCALAAVIVFGNGAALGQTERDRKQFIKPPVRPVSLGTASNTGQATGSNLATAAVPGCPVAQNYGDANFDGRVDLSDVLCVLDGFAGLFGSCAFEFVDLHPCGGGNGRVDIDDVTAVLAAYGGEPACPNSCPPCSANTPPIAIGGADMSGTTAESFPFDGRLSTDADGFIVSYEWDFGDGLRSSLPATSHVYAQPGTYDVRLAVLDTCGATTMDTVRVTVSAAACNGNDPPIARAGSDQSVGVGATVSLNGATSSDPDGVVSAYWWSFGDGFSTGWQASASTQHVYSAGGTYNATLWVRDNCGAVSPSDTATILVGSNPCANNQPPVAVLVGSANGTVGAPVALSAVGSADPDGTIQTYSWSFGDGTSGSGQTVSHTFNAAGAYSVSVTITDNCGAADTERLTITISAPSCGAGNLPPTAVGGPDRTAAVNTSLTFDGSASSDADGQVREYWWNFGDGFSTGWQTSPVATHTYTAPATYTAKLWVRDNCQASSAPDNVTVTITGGACSVNVPPLANAGPDQQGEADEPIEFSAASSSDSDGWIQTYAWNFGDGTTGTGLNVQHTYTQAGVFTVTLTVTDNCGTGRTDTALVTIAPSSFVPIDPEFIGWVEGSIGQVQDVCISPNGQRAYLASRDLGIVEFDITNPRSPRYTRTSTVFQNAPTCVVNETYIVIGGATTGAAFTLLSTFGTASEVWTPLNVVAQGLALRGNTLAVAAGASGFHLFNLAGSNGPQSLGSLQMFARGVAISPSGGFAYVAAGGGSNGGLKVVNIQAAPALRGTLSANGSANSADIVLDSTGNYAFVSDNGGGIRVVDVRNPDQPRHVTAVPVPGVADRIARTGNTLVVTSATGASSLQVFDAANPESPQARGMVSGFFVGLDARGTYAFAAQAAAGWAVVDIANPNSPQVAWYQQPTLGARGACAAAIVGSKKLAVVGGVQAVAAVVDVTNPFAPTLASTLPSLASDVAIRGNLAYVASSAGLKVFDITNATSPTLITTVTGPALGVAFVPGRPWAMVAGSSEGLRVVDVTVPTQPVVRHTLRLTGAAFDVAVSPSGTIAFVSDMTAGLTVVDIATPTSPVVRSTRKYPEGPASHVAAHSDNLVAMVNSGNSPGVSLVDVSDPYAPERLSWIGGLAGSIDFFAHYLLMPGGTTGLSFLDISDPVEPQLVRTADSPGSVLSVAVLGDYAYLGDDATTLDVVKIR